MYSDLVRTSPLSKLIVLNSTILYSILFYCILFPGVSDPSLVYDKFANVEKLVEKARKLKSKEKDMVRLQLLDMSDSLPPLSKFTHGYKFDPWQRRGTLLSSCFCAVLHDSVALILSSTIK